MRGTYCATSGLESPDSAGNNTCSFWWGPRCPLQGRWLCRPLPANEDLRKRARNSVSPIIVAPESRHRRLPILPRDQPSHTPKWTWRGIRSCRLVSVICGRLLQQVSSTVWTTCRLRGTTFTLAMNTLSSWAGAWRAFSPLGPTRHYPENHYPKSDNWPGREGCGIRWCGSILFGVEVELEEPPSMAPPAAGIPTWRHAPCKKKGAA